MFLVDTNVWLEILLRQERAEPVQQFLQGIPDHSLAISEFSLSSIGLILTDAGATDGFKLFLQDAFVDGSVERISLRSTELMRIPSIMRDENLDFDDAYQYAASDVANKALVTFDTDFEGTDIDYYSPIEAPESAQPGNP